MVMRNFAFTVIFWRIRLPPLPLQGRSYRSILHSELTEGVRHQPVPILHDVVNVLAPPARAF